MKRKTLFILILLVSAVLIFYFNLSAQYDSVSISLNIDANETPEDVERVVGILDQRNITSTLFVTEKFAVKNPELVEETSKNHEVACRGLTGTNTLPKANATEKEQIIIRCKEEVERITGESVEGFRAPSHNIDKESFEIVEKHYSYDATLFENYEWFYPEPSLPEAETSTLFFYPFTDTVGLSYLELGFFYFDLVKLEKSRKVSLTFHPSTLKEYDLEFSQLMDFYIDRGVEFKTASEFAEV